MTLAPACSDRKPGLPKNANTSALIANVLYAGDYHVRIAAAQRLQRVRSPAVIAPLIAALNDPVVEVRLAAVDTLGRTRDASAVPPLCAVLDSLGQGKSMRIAAVAALGRLHDPSSINCLVRALPDRRQEASAVLVSFGSAAVPSLIEALGDESSYDAAEALATIGSAAVDPLVEVLHHADRKFVQQEAARALAEIPDPRAAAALNEALKHPDPALTAAAYRFLIRKGESGTEGRLIEALNRDGTRQMAEDFATSGNAVLKAGAQQWSQNTQTALSGKQVNNWGWGKWNIPNTQLALFHFDNSPVSTSGVRPVQSRGISFVPGRWGSALSVERGGILEYPLAGNLDLRNGSIEMWISPRFAGTDPVYVKYNHALLLYQSRAGDQFLVSESVTRGLYAGSVVGHSFAGAGGGDISTWRPGEWHHLAFTWSSAHTRERVYIDGAMAMESGAPMVAPPMDGRTFTVGCDPYGNPTGFIVDELRISNDEEPPEEVRFNAYRTAPFGEREIFRSLIGAF